MITRKIIKKILPKALPLAVVLISSTYSWQALADKQAKPVKPAAVKNELTDGVAPDSDSSAPSSSSSGSRVKELVYGESNVYVIRTKYGYQTNIVFDPKEEIQTISVGDRSLWQLIPAGHRLFIRPMSEDISTNMTLITNKHSYEFDLKSVSRRNESNIYVARFTYPSESGGDGMVAAIAAANGFATAKGNAAPPLVPVAETKVPVPTKDVTSDAQHTLKLPSPSSAVEKPKQEVMTGVSSTLSSSPPSHPNYSYTYAGSDALAPLQVYDDGKSTFVKYQTIGQTAPSAFIIGKDGKESPISAMVQGSSLVINGVAGELALREHDGEIRIYNESINPR